MKKIIYLYFIGVSAVIVYDSISRSAYSYSTGADPGHCGAPNDGYETCTHCHSDYAEMPLPGLITSNVPLSGYVPGTTYTITAGISRPGHLKFGFQVSPQDSSGNLMGTLINTSTETQLVGAFGQYITHTASGNSGAGSKFWSFDWMSPVAGTGPVTFYGAFNVTNGNNDPTGDSIFVFTLIINENTNSVEEFFNDAYVSVYPNPINKKTVLSFYLNQSEQLKIKVLDIYGNICKTIESEQYVAGANRVFLCMDGLSAGIYFIHITGHEHHTIKKLIVMN